MIKNQRLKSVAVIVSHPTQYYSPWFRSIAATGSVKLKVFYLWDFGINVQIDRAFGAHFQWDIPLLDGYEYEFVPNVCTNPGTHSFGGLNNPSLITRLKDFAPDAVMIFGYGWRSMLEFILRRPRSMPVLIRGDAHLLSPRSRKLTSLFKRRIVRLAISRCHAALSVGAANRQFYLANGFPDSQIVHVPHCVDNQRFLDHGDADTGLKKRKELDVSATTKVVLFAGKFEYKKRPDLLVKAFRQVEDNNAVLLMVGSGAMHEDLLQMAADDMRIRFLPFQNQTEMPNIYAAADLVVLPSQGPHETWGLMINESMNCGCAAIVSSHVGCGPDLVHPGKNGWQFEAGSLEGLEKVLADALSDPECLKRYGAASIKLVQDYSFEAATSGLLKAVDLVTLPPKERM